MNTPPIGNITLLNHHFGTLTDLLNGVLDWMLGLAAALAVVAVVYSGIMYIMAGGDESKAENAKKNLLWAIIGIVIIALSYLIIHEIGQVLGAF